MIIRDARKKLAKEEKRRSIIAELTRPLSWSENDEADFSFSTTRRSQLFTKAAVPANPVINEEDEALESASVKSGNEVAATSNDTGSYSDIIGDTTISSAERTEDLLHDKDSKTGGVVYADASTHMERKGCQGCCWCTTRG
jgi:hypothetical protein